MPACLIQYDPAADQTTRLLRYDKWQDGTLRTTELQTFRLQHWNLREFEGLLAEAGFTDILVTAGYKNAGMGRDGDGIWTFHAATPRARRTSERTRWFSQPGALDLRGVRQELLD